MLAQRLHPDATHDAICATSARWGIRPELVQLLVRMAGALEFGVSITSGARTRAEQVALEEAGRPAAPFALSTHANEDEDGCGRLATGVDLSTLVAPVPAVQARLGAEATLVGLRWGGGSPVDPSTGIPSDWNHLDLGPRSTHP